MHATPLVRALKAAIPDSQIVVAVSGLATPLFAFHPAIERTLVTANPLKDLRGAVRDLRAASLFDNEPFCAITTTGNERTRIALAALLGGAYARVGFTEAPEIYDSVFRFDRSQSQMDNNLRIVEAFGRPFRHYEPQVFFRDEDLSWARNVLDQAGVKSGQMIVAFVTQTSVTQRKGWRRERFQAVARHLVSRYGAHIVFVGTKAEAAAIEEIREGLGASTSSLAGKTTLLQLTALLSLCRVGLTLDTGILHLGRTVGLPMAVIAPAWSPPIEWLPVDSPRYRILKNADLPKCPPDYIIDEVPVEDAIAALDELITAYPEGALSPQISVVPVIPAR